LAPVQTQPFRERARSSVFPEVAEFFATLDLGSMR